MLVTIFPLFIGISNISLFHLPFTKSWATHAMPNAPLPYFLLAYFSTVVMFLWYSLITSLSHSSHSLSEANYSAHLKPSILSIDHPSYRDCVKKMGYLINFINYMPKRHLHGYSLLAAAQFLWGGISLFKNNCWIIFILLCSYVLFVLRLYSLRCKPESMSSLIGAVAYCLNIST